jgi:hypothetical protein
MRLEGIQDVTRRSAIKSIIGYLTIGATGSKINSISATTDIDATITMDNVGRTAYEVSSVSGTNVSAETGINNPEITFTATGTRYRIENNGHPNHPLEFQDENGTILLSQDDSGSFDDDDAVNWVNNGDSIEFTLTSQLSTQIATYRCTVHSNSMVGDITVDTPMVDYTPNTGSVSFTTPADGATATTPVSFEMTAENFTVEAASNGVRDGAGHLHILVDQPAIEPGEVIPNNEPNGYYHYGDGSTSAEIDLEPGTHTVRVQAGDAKHRAYDLTDTIEITAKEPQETTDNPELPDGSGPATDPDGDGQLEDVNGDGTADFNDAVDLAFNTDSDAVSGNPRFDFDNDGDVDFADAIALAFE